ncbi:hypothetical protein D9M68_361360 [compost metagenome]|uniref:Uncharacterized protein n=1 Tax=Pseudomonas jinjuensis TaxID=198616 RepID=A0A1H0JS53_9PSED|nr:hypothetical protein [Pseudomonas jinjuensis]SDO46241.1 hypothetical protein SAMN05216193_111176 [Pseudomonas jinjuensis]
MRSHDKLMTLEMACTALKQKDVRLLAAVADQLSSILIPESEFNPVTVRYADQDPLNPEYPITYGDLAQYLNAATGRYVPVLFETPDRTVESCRVLVNRDWFDRQATAAKEKLGLAITAQSPAANQIASVAQSANAIRGHWAEQPAPMSSDGIQNLHLMLAHQNDQRKAQLAASKDVEARIRAEERLHLLEAQLSEATAKVRALEVENRALDLEVRTSDRRRQDAEIERDGYRERLAVFAACLDPHSSVYPSELAIAFKCWCDLTNNGSHDPTSSSKRGVHKLVNTWADQHCPDLLPDQLKRIRAVLSWRKRGSGAIGSK